MAFNATIPRLYLDKKNWNISWRITLLELSFKSFNLIDSGSISLSELNSQRTKSSKKRGLEIFFSFFSNVNKRSSFSSQKWKSNAQTHSESGTTNYFFGARSKFWTKAKTSDREKKHFCTINGLQLEIFKNVLKLDFL